jgi:hypothetical protein
MWLGGVPILLFEINQNQRLGSLTESLDTVVMGHSRRVRCTPDCVAKLHFFFAGVSAVALAVPFSSH